MTKITLNRKEFVEALAIGGSFAGKSKVLAILDCVKIKVASNTLSIVSTDNENAINKRMQVEHSDGDVTFCVDYKSISSYVKLISGEFCDLVVNDNMINIEHSKGNMSIPLVDCSDFPSLKGDDNSKTVVVPSALVNNWIVEGRSFVANDVLRLIMSTVYFYSKDGEFGCCSTDGHALFTDNENLGLEDFEFNLNRSAFKAVCDAISSTDDVTIKIGDKNVLFVGNNVSILTRMTEGKYVNFKSVFPNSMNLEMKVSKNDMLDAISRCKMATNGSSSLIKLNITENNLQISASDVDFNKEAIENISVESNGSIEIGLNANILSMVLGNISTNNAIMRFLNNTRPCIILEDNDESNKQMLVMPMMLN